MKKNPYEEAAKIELAIIDMRSKLKKKEDEARKIIDRLKSVDANSQDARNLRESLQQREHDINRKRKFLNAKIKQKRKKELEGRILQFGGFKKMKQYIEKNRDVSKEIRDIDEVLSQVKNLRLFSRTSRMIAEKNIQLFISHASEDKDSFVRPLAEELIRLGVSVWYDEYSLTVGDSLRKSIDRGLSGCRYGLIVLSKSFFEKNWTQYELNGLVAKEMQGEKVILPIWHRITKDEVLQFSPTLVDKVALNSAILSVNEIAIKIKDAISCS